MRKRARSVLRNAPGDENQVTAYIEQTPSSKHTASVGSIHDVLQREESESCQEIGLLLRIVGIAKQSEGIASDFWVKAGFNSAYTGGIRALAVQDPRRRV